MLFSSQKIAVLFVLFSSALMAGHAWAKGISCNDGDFSVNSYATPQANGRITWPTEASLPGTRRRANGVIDYFLKTGAITQDDLYIYQSYDPTTHTYPTVRSLALYASLNQEPDFSSNNSVLLHSYHTDHSASLQREGNGARLTIGTSSWYFENCRLYQ